MEFKTVYYPGIYSKLHGKVGEFNVKTKVKEGDLAYCVFYDGGPCNLGYVEKIYKQNHLIPDGNKNAGQKFKLMVRPLSDYYFKKEGYNYLPGIGNEDIIKINELKQGYFYDLLNNRNTELVEICILTQCLFIMIIDLIEI